MASKWRKAKLALGCISIPRTLDDSPPLHSASSAADRRSSDAVSPSSESPQPSLSLTPTPSSSGLRLSKQSSKSSKIQISATNLVLSKRARNWEYSFLNVNLLLLNKWNHRLDSCSPAQLLDIQCVYD